MKSVVGEGEYWYTPLIVELDPIDAPLYGLLQWEEEHRHHPDLGMISALRSLAWYIVSVVGHFIVLAIILSSLYGIMSLTDVAMFVVAGIVGAFLLPVIELVSAVLVLRYVRQLRNIKKVREAILERVAKHGRTRDYYRELLSKLCDANAKDKAAAARIMLRNI